MFVSVMCTCVFWLPGYDGCCDGFELTVCARDLSVLSLLNQ